MQILKIGGRLKSAVCDGEVIVVAAPKVPVNLTCGGVPMSEAAANPRATLAAEHAGELRIGKRYATEDASVEVLCVKGGAGALAVGGIVLAEKSAKKLPKTD
jgi:hypothetical protein